MFAIGQTALVTAPADGPLYLFANDIWGMYWNNKSELDVTIG